ncbi:MAG: peptidoglycan -binding protein [Alphaproteobacteria bacterium]
MLSSRRRSQTFDIWPGFVDALSALLMVIIFVLMTFVLSQMYLSYALNAREKALEQQDTHISELLRKLKATQNEKTTTEAQLTAIKSTLQQMESKQESLMYTLHQTSQDKQNAVRQIATLKDDMQRLNEVLAAEQVNLNQEKLLSTSLMEDVNKQTKLSKTLEEEILTLKSNHSQALDKLRAEFLEKAKSSAPLSQFRSEFLASLQKILGDRSDVRIVGDRFIFQSEVFFDIGSADLGVQGKEQLTQLAKALKEIAAKIPPEVNWILRIDGHTDQRPIKTKFRSNWELSAGRALSVVSFLILQGVAPERLVAAGFGQFQPLVKNSTDEKELARNRRIEFRLDQR